MTFSSVQPLTPVTEEWRCNGTILFANERLAGQRVLSLLDLYIPKVERLLLEQDAAFLAAEKAARTPFDHEIARFE